MDALSFAVQALTSLAVDAFRQDLGFALQFAICLISAVLVFLRTQRIATAQQATRTQTRSSNRNDLPDAPAPESVGDADVKPVANRTAKPRGGVQSVFRACGLLAMVLFAVILGVEYFGTPTLLRRAFETLHQKSGIKITFETATGGFLQGELVLRNIKISRQNHPQSNFDLVCGEARIRGSAWTILTPGRVFKELQLARVTGNYEQQPRAAKPQPQPQPQPQVNNVPAPPAPLADEAKKRVEVGHLSIIDSQIHITDRSVEGEPVEFDLTLNRLDCPSFRSDRAPFDICFRSQIDGLLDEQKFHVASRETPEGSRTEWNATKLPLKLVRAYLNGPFRWLAEGSFDLQATQFVKIDRTQPVQFNCRLVLNDVRVQVPDGLRPAIRVGAIFLADYINQQDKPLPLNFQTEQDRKRFDLRTVESLEQFWSQIQRAAIASLLKTTGRKLDVVADFIGAENSEEVVDKVSDLAARAIERIKQRKKAKRDAKLKRAGLPEE
jgi:hypothetical protein